MSESTWDDPRITAYVLGELTGEERREFESLLESDGDLAAAVDEARSVTGQLEGLYAAEPTQPLESDRRESIMSGGTSVATPVVESNPNQWTIPALVIATAATLALMIGLGPWMRSQQINTVTQETNAPARSAPAASLADAEEERFELPSESREYSVAQNVESPQDPEPSFAVRADGRSVTLDFKNENLRKELLDRGKDPSDATAALGAAAAGFAEADMDDAFAAPAADAPDLGIAQSQPSPMPESAAPQSGGQQSQPGAKGGKARDMLGQAGRSAAPVQRRMSRSALPDSSRALSTATPAPGTKPAPAAQPAPAPAGAPAPAANPSPVPSRARAQAETVAPTSEAAPMTSRERLVEREAKSLKSANSPAPMPVELESVDELGTIVLRGANRDVEMAKAMAENVEVQREIEQLKKDRSKLNAEVEAQLRAAGKQLQDRFTVEQKAPARHVRLQPMFRQQLSEIQEQLEMRERQLLFGGAVDEGRGPGISGDRFDPITENPFKRVEEEPLSTFSVDVDTASYSKTRDFLMRANRLPRPDAVRIEELLNYFDYEYDPPSDADKHPFAARATVTACPWNESHRLARIALKGKLMKKDERPQANLVFLLDTSGSMRASNKMPLVKEGMQMLLKQLKKDDRVAIVVYAGSAGMALESTPAKKKKKIRNAIEELNAGGSTNGAAGIALAYQLARENFITEGVNRVILCTDGDFNVGTTGTDELVRMVEQESKGGIFLSVLGFGMGNHNDSMLEQISGRGNGNYAFIDNALEAKKVLVDQTDATLVTIAKDVKLQIEFNPKYVSSYRLIGYVNRVMAKEDFKDDTKDAGEIGAGHAVTALYELVPPGVENEDAPPKVDALKYQSKLEPTEASDSDETLTLKLRYKEPDGDTGIDVEFPVTDDGGDFDEADHEVRFAAAVASFGMQLRRSKYAGDWKMADVIRVADDSKGEDVDGLRAEFVTLATKAKSLMGEE